VHQQRIGGEVVYSIVVPETRELLLAARRLLLQVLSDQDRLKTELRGDDEADADVEVVAHASEG
jgi:ArsR family transcriptional regulator